MDGEGSGRGGGTEVGEHLGLVRDDRIGMGC